MTVKSWIPSVLDLEHGDVQFDWNDVRLFVLVAQCGSFRRASIKSKKSVNSLRRRIRQLEHRMRCRLLVRDVQGSYLTERGHRLFEASRQMLEASYEVGREFHDSHPDIRIELQCFHSSSNVDVSRADIKVRHEQPLRNDLIVARLGHLHEQLFASPQLISEFGKPSRADKLLQFKFIERENAEDVM